MMFENFRLTGEEREKLAARNIKNPHGSFRDVIKGINPIYLTFDRETGNWLAHCYHHHDLDGDISEFIFMYDNVPIPVQAEVVRENKIIWKITRIDTDNNIMDKLFMSTLCKAFKAYGSGGTPNEANANVGVVFMKKYAVKL